MNVDTLLAFTDAIKIARGCHDYNGGHKDSKESEIYHHGIQTVVNILEACEKEGGMNAQVRACFRIGSTAAAAKLPEPSGWPVPRDTKTDPPTEADSDFRAQVLVFSEVENRWTQQMWVKAKHYARWLPLPPIPPPAKTAAEIAYVAEITHGAEKDQKWIDKHSFIKGFEAGKGAKK